MPREASEMFQCIKYEDKREVFGLKIHSFSTLDRIKKYDDSDNEKNAEKPYSIKVGETKRTINLYAIATTKFQIAVYTMPRLRQQNKGTDTGGYRAKELPTILP